MTRLTPCPACSRHLLPGETSCPFCAAEREHSATPLRGAVFALVVGAGLLGACSSSDTGNDSAAYGPPPFGGGSGGVGATGGSGGTAGASTGGTAGASTGGTAGASTGGSAGVPADAGSDADTDGSAGAAGAAGVAGDGG